MIASYIYFTLSRDRTQVLPKALLQVYSLSIYPSDIRAVYCVGGELLVVLLCISSPVSPLSYGQRMSD